MEYDLIAESYRRRPWEIVSKVLSGETTWFADLGSGPGQHSRHLATLNEALRGVLIDVSAEMIHRALKETPENLSHRLYPVLADMRELPMRSDSVDSLLLIASLHHVVPRADRLRTLRECRRVLRGGGLLLVVVWARWQKPLVLEVLKDSLSYVLRRKESFWDITRCSRVACRTYHLYSVKELVKELETAGFRVVEKGVYVPGEVRKPLNKNYYCLAIKT
ncbi:MAG: class I SAM-dependent methyltransferase [Desulfurococcaceae archaeon]|jgi:tRNA (uracil-5-)-methyltransferase TRM9|nr:class I SAM-dependent methyltransferase [Desulfurococcaceae archaeon]